MTALSAGAGVCDPSADGIATVASAAIREQQQLLLMCALSLVDVNAYGR